jgi:hypothetical protein
MQYFCTYFDSHYLPRGLALYESLKRHSAGFRLWALCMDQACYRTLREMNLPENEPIALEEFERGDGELLCARRNRSAIEYYFTCTPSLCLYILNHRADVDAITYLDSDLFFFGDPQVVYDEMDGHSIGIIEHRFPRRLQGNLRFGIYNVGWLTFRRDENGLACLRWWRERCNEWCYDRVEPERYADQKYLDRWPSLFSGVHVIRHEGANLAPWNIANYRITREGQQVMVNGRPVIFFHFQGMKQLTRWLYNSNFGLYRTRPSRLVRRFVFGPYVRALRQAAPNQDLSRGIRQADSRFNRSWRALRRAARVCLGLMTQEYLLVIKDQVL